VWGRRRVGAPTPPDGSRYARREGCPRGRSPCRRHGSSREDHVSRETKRLQDLGEDEVPAGCTFVTVGEPLMQHDAALLVRTSHARGAYAIGDMVAFVPSRREPQVNAKATAKVHEDKERGSCAGVDGSWVAHLGLVPPCREVFDSVLGDRPNQLGRRRDDVETSASAPLDVRSAGRSRMDERLHNDVILANVEKVTCELVEVASDDDFAAFLTVVAYDLVA